jgi:hypothetical protein
MRASIDSNNFSMSCADRFDVISTSAGPPVIVVTTRIAPPSVALIFAFEFLEQLLDFCTRHVAPPGRFGHFST